MNSLTTRTQSPLDSYPKQEGRFSSPQVLASHPARSWISLNKPIKPLYPLCNLQGLFIGHG